MASAAFLVLLIRWGGKRRISFGNPQFALYMGEQMTIIFRETGARYVSGHVVLDEQWAAGRLCTRYWSPNGQVWPEMHLQQRTWAVDQPADTFRLDIDGQDLRGGWAWVGSALTPDPSGYRADGRTVTHGVITLQHAGSGVEVKVHTRLDGSPFLIRWLEITNQAAKAVSITQVAPFSGLLWNHRVDEHLASFSEAPFAIAYTHQYNWGQEGDCWFEPLPAGMKTVNGGKLGRSGWGRPAFWARNRSTGQTFVCELAWGGNYEFSLDCRTRDVAGWGAAKASSHFAELYFRMGLAGWDQALRVLLPGETISTPAVHLGLFDADDNAIVQATHDHVRHVVMPAPVPGRYIEIEANHRGYLCDRENEPDLKRDEEVAKAIGTELYVIDAGWYGNTPNQWGNNVGDWWAGEWLPNGLEPIADYAHLLGMRFGLWMEIEAVGANSTLRKEHPDWLYTRNGQPVADGRALDFTNPAVAAWAEAELARAIEQYQLDMYRIDHNHNISPSGNRQFAGFTEDLTWRYYDALYAIFDRLRERYPHIVFQNCAGGGGRLDWGTMHRFHNAELSDWMRFPRGLKILNGISLSLPPEVLLRTFGTEMPEIDLDADIDTQLRVVCLSRPIFRGIAPSVEAISPFLKERIDHHLALFRKIIRPVMVDARVFHHTPFLSHSELTPWCVLEYASPRGDTAVAGVFHTSGEGSEYLLRPRGLDVGRDYMVTLDNRGQTYRASGSTLMRDGLLIRLPRALSSELVIFSEV